MKYHNDTVLTNWEAVEYINHLIFAANLKRTIKILIYFLTTIAL